MSQLGTSGCDVVSHEEPFIRSLGPFGEIVIHMLSMFANQESERRSQRIKTGIARAKREGRTVGGRKPGSRNRNPRPELKGEAAGWSDARRLERSRPNHRKSCVPDCMETSAHGPERGSVSDDPGREDCAEVVRRALVEGFPREVVALGGP